MAAMLGPGGPSTAAKFAVDSPGRPRTAGDQLRRDRSPVLGVVDWPLINCNKD